MTCCIGIPSGWSIRSFFGFPPHAFSDASHIPQRVNFWDTSENNARYIESRSNSSLDNYSADISLSLLNTANRRKRVISCISTCLYPITCPISTIFSSCCCAYQDCCYPICSEDECTLYCCSILYPYHSCLSFPSLYYLLPPERMVINDALEQIEIENANAREGVRLEEQRTAYVRKLAIEEEWNRKCEEAQRKAREERGKEQQTMRIVTTIKMEAQYTDTP